MRFADITPSGQPTVSPVSAARRPTGRSTPGCAGERVEPGVITGNASAMVSPFPPRSRRTQFPAIESKRHPRKRIQPVSGSVKQPGGTNLTQRSVGCAAKYCDWTYKNRRPEQFLKRKHRHFPVYSQELLVSAVIAGLSATSSRRGGDVLYNDDESRSCYPLPFSDRNLVGQFRHDILGARIASQAQQRTANAGGRLCDARGRLRGGCVSA